MNFPFENKLWFKGSSAIGVEVYIKADGEFSYHFVELVREKDEVKIERQTDDISTLIGYGKRTIPITVVISGTGIVIRHIDRLTNISDEECFDKILGNARFEDFYFQRFIASDDKEIVALVRKNILDNLVEELNLTIEKYKLSVTHFFLGPGILSQFLNFSNVRQSFFSTSSHTITLDHGAIVELSKTNDSDGQDLRFDSEIIDSESVLPYFAALSFFTFPSNINNLFLNKDAFEKKYVFGRLFDLLKWPVLIVLFLVFMINFFLFDSYDSRFSTLSKEAIVSQGIETRVDSLRLLSERKRLFVEQAYHNSAPFSFFVDRIMQFAPKSVVLSYCSVFPIEGKIRDGEKPVLSRQIVIKGHTNYSLDLNTWINQLKKENWIHVVNISNYNYQSEESNGLFELIIEIVESKKGA